MGHLTRLANTIAKQADSSNLGEFLSNNVPDEELSEWGEFVKTTLESINKTHEHCLVSICIKLYSLCILIKNNIYLVK